jgi:hypothetical protein
MAISSSGNSVEHSVAGKMTVRILGAFDAEGADSSDIAGKTVNDRTSADNHIALMPENSCLSINPPYFYRTYFIVSVQWPGSLFVKPFFPPENMHFEFIFILLFAENLQVIAFFTGGVIIGLNTIAKRRNSRE